MLGRVVYYLTLSLINAAYVVWLLVQIVIHPPYPGLLAILVLAYLLTATVLIVILFGMALRTFWYSKARER